MYLLRMNDYMKLSPKKANFVVEYVKDFAPRRAAEASGYSPEYGHGLLRQPEILAVIESILQDRLEANMIDSDWLLGEMVDNHLIARQQGNISASNTALAMVGKHKKVDAFAADKMTISTDADVINRLNDARKKLANVSFL